MKKYVFSPLFALSAFLTQCGIDSNQNRHSNSGQKHSALAQQSAAAGQMQTTSESDEIDREFGETLQKRTSLSVTKVAEAALATIPESSIAPMIFSRYVASSDPDKVAQQSRQVQKEEIAKKIIKHAGLQTFYFIDNAASAIDPQTGKFHSNVTPETIFVRDFEREKWPNNQLQTELETRKANVMNAIIERVGKDRLAQIETLRKIHEKEMNFALETTYLKIKHRYSADRLLENPEAMTDGKLSLAFTHSVSEVDPDRFEKIEVIWRNFVKAKQQIEQDTISKDGPLFFGEAGR